MPKSEKQKLKIFYIADYLMRKTDDERDDDKRLLHTVLLKDIKKYLIDEKGIEAEEHSIRRDIIQMSGVFAELELRIIRSRVRSGMANAAAKGVKIGRPQTTLEDVPASFLRHYPAYKAGSLNVSELARVCDLSRTTTYKYIGLLEQK